MRTVIVVSDPGVVLCDHADLRRFAAAILRRIGVPRARAPHLVLDMSTSVVAAGRVAEWRDRGESIPRDWVTETGALRPVGGFKGFGLALVAEALAGALTGAGTVTADPEHDDQGALVIALDVARLRPLDEFSAEVERFIRSVRHQPRCQEPH